MNLDYLISPKTNGANPFRIFEELDHHDSEEIAFRIKQLSYQAFLKTAYWFSVSSVAKSRAGMRCQVCNSTDRIQVHHRTYATHGYEHKHMEDLVVLCNGCHWLFHGHQTPDYIPAMVHKEKTRKVRAGRIVPHTEADIQIPDGEFITLTLELVRNCRTKNGAFTNATLRALGVCKPLITGWPHRLVGKRVERGDYLNAVRGRYIYSSGPLERAATANL